MVRIVSLLTFIIFLTVPSSATVILFSQNFESGTIPGQFYGGTLLNTSGVPPAAGDGNWALYNNSGGTPQGTASNPIGLQLSGLQPFQAANLQFTFIAVDSWDGVDLSFSPDLFSVQVNPDVLFQAAFRNWMGTHYTGDGTYPYGSTTPANSTITLLSSDNNYLVSSANDSFYDIHLDGFHADAAGNLNIYFYAGGAGWQGGNDESFAIDNLLITAPDIFTETPEPGTWLTLSAGLAALLAHRSRRS
ncbi:MAG: hypothetical protein JWP63_5373 [Candidatus Solibacter sp.]|nr:hypothetical protein [Candidatus Solibacter sp.]